MRLATAGLTALFAVLLAAPAYATAAEPGVGSSFSLTVNKEVVHSGEPLTVTASAKVMCTWLVEWNGDRRHTVARHYVTTYTAPEVTKSTRMALHGTCFYTTPAKKRPRTSGDAPAAGSVDAQTVVAEIPPHWERSIMIRVLPRRGIVSPPEGGGGVGGVHTGGGLPNTGGPDLWVLLAGLGAVLAGSVLVRRAQEAA